MWYSYPSIAFAPSSRLPVIAAGPMENKRDAASAGLAWPISSRSFQTSSLPAEPTVVADSSAPTSAPSEILTFTR